MSRELWATPSYARSDGPSRWLHVKTTPKRIEVKIREASSYADRFSREGDLPDGAVGWKAGSIDGQIVLFEDRNVCLRYMAQRARRRAEAAEEKAARLRANADRWEAEAAE